MNVAEKKETKKKAVKKKKEEKIIEDGQPVDEDDEIIVSVDSENIWKIATFILGILLIASIFTNGFQFSQPTGSQTQTPTTTIQGTPQPTTVSQANKIDVGDNPTIGNSDAPVTIIEYSDFQCPYCSRFITGAYAEIKKQYIDTGKVRLAFKHFPLGFHENAQKAAEATECANDQGKFWQYHDKLFENQGSLDVDNLKKYAQDLGLDMRTFTSCLDSGKHEQAVKKDMADGTQAGVQGTPSFLINGKLVVGAQPFENFKTAIDQALAGDSGQPQEVTTTPQNTPTTLPKVDLEYIILNDDDCTTCDSSRLELTFQNLFPGAQAKKVDVKTEEGKALVKEVGATRAPTYVFPSKVESAEAWKNPQISSAFVKVGSYYKLSEEVTGATYFIDEQARIAFEKEEAEKQKKGMEALGAKSDDNRPQIDFFVMSYCPYGNQAEEGIEPVYQVLKDKADFNPRYVIYSNYQGGGPSYCLDDESKYCSMHGIQELNQGIRELCVAKYIGMDEYFEFVLEMNKKCNSGNADECWVAVSEGLGLDTAKIKSCEADEGEALVAEELELNTLLGVRGSPSIFIDGESYEGGRTPAAYQTALCEAFDDPPAECATVQDAAGAAVEGQC
ncbi:MAG: thioredoxin domain-containing protein [Candidatus Altiarchaeota archaeon]